MGMNLAFWRPSILNIKCYSVEQIITAVKQHEADATVADICRKTRITQSTLHCWKRTTAGSEPDQLRELRQLHKENERLKLIVAD